MLSYLHSFHAGNHADLLKHITLAQILRRLNSKDAPYTFFDTHAGSALYSLEGPNAQKTSEAKSGVLKLWSEAAAIKKSGEPLPDAIDFYLSIIAPYIKVLCYPGSPLIERALMRSDSPLTLCELHPEEVKKLRENIAGENSFIDFPENNAGSENGKTTNAKNIVVCHTDGLKKLFASTPPKGAAKRGAILIDPSYEEKNEFDDVASAVCKVHKKWSAAIVAIWYPLLTRKKNLTEKMLAQIMDAAKRQNPNTSILRAEFLIAPEDDFAYTAQHLYGSGMFVVNSPWKLDSDLRASLDFLCARIYNDGKAKHRIHS